MTLVSHCPLKIYSVGKVLLQPLDKDLDKPMTCLIFYITDSSTLEKLGHAAYHIHQYYNLTPHLLPSCTWTGCRLEPL